MVLIKDAPKAWNLLNGIVCVYKPAEVSLKRVRNALLTKLCNDLNSLECRPVDSYVAIAGDTPDSLTVDIKPNYADHPLVVGDRYQICDFKCHYTIPLGLHTSGVLVLGINDGTKNIYALEASQPVRTYRIKGVLGSATDTFFKNGKIIEKSTYKHVTHDKIDKILASLQAAHQKKMFELCGLDIQSQAAYELAARGPIRPENEKVPVVYGIKCIDFVPPEFTVEVHCINEYEKYLQTLIHEIGMQARSTAHCTGIQCIRYGFFSIGQALLQKHWTLEHVLENISLCKKIVNENIEYVRKQPASLAKIQNVARTRT